MTSLIDLRPTCCAICGSDGDTTEIYPERLGPAAFTADTFSARRLPDRIHYRIVKCQTCGLVRSDPTAPPELVADLYARSSFDYEREAGNLQRTYGGYLRRLLRWRPADGALLEIGCGNGFFLEEAVRQGYNPVSGVEPSRDAVARAEPIIREGIVCDIMRPGLFEADRFDAICLFQVFDHLTDPAGLLEECRRTLRPGGLILCLNHNVDSMSSRLLRERSPIVDVEHTYLYSPRTMARIFSAHGMVPRAVGPATNIYSVEYLTHLLPLPEALKKAALSVMQNTRLGRIRLPVRLGNLFLIAQKPESP